MIASQLLIQNRTGAVLHTVIRPLNGSLVIMLFKAANLSSMDIPPGLTATIEMDDAIRSCLNGTNLRFQLRNRSGNEIGLGIGVDTNSGNPAIIIFPPKDEDEGGDD